jgi:hypothetical protein
LVNLLVEDTLNVFAALASLFLLARYVLRDRTYPLVGTLSAAGFLAVAPTLWVFDFTANTFYGVWLALGLAGLVLAENRPTERSLPRWRWWLALGMFVLVHWVFAAAAFLLAPLAVLRWLLLKTTPELPPAADQATAQARHQLFAGRLRRAMTSELGTALVLLALGFAAGFLLMRLVHIACRTGLGTLPVSQWWGTWCRLAGNSWADLAPYGWPLVLAGAAMAGVVGLLVPGVRRQAGEAWRLAAALSGTALAYSLFLATREWMALNSCCARYTRPSVFLLQGALLIVGVTPLYAALPGFVRKGLAPLAAPVLLLAALIGYGSPSLQGVRAQLDRTLGTCTGDILAARCTHVAGNYWTVWPVVFHANLTLYEQGGVGSVWGITTRCEETLGRWRDMPREMARIAVAAGGDADANPYLRAIGFPVLEVAEKRPTVWVLRPPAALLQARLNARSPAPSIANRR